MFRPGDLTSRQVPVPDPHPACLTSQPQSLLAIPQRFLGLLSFSDVSNGAAKQSSLLRLQRAKTDLYRKLVTILAQPIQIKPCAHGPELCAGSKVGTVGRVCIAQALRHQNFDL